MVKKVSFVGLKGGNRPLLDPPLFERMTSLVFNSA